MSEASGQRMGGRRRGRVGDGAGRRCVRRLAPLAGAVAVLAVAACASDARPPAITGAPDSRVADPSDPIAVELEALRAAVIDYYRSERPEHWERFVAELERGAIFLEDVLYEGSPPQIGVWKLVVEDGRTALVREPPVPPRFPALMFYWGVWVACEEGTWRVTGEYFLVDEVSMVEPTDDEDPRPAPVRRGALSPARLIRPPRGRQSIWAPEGTVIARAGLEAGATARATLA